MLKKMLLFIAISSSFLPVFGETKRQVEKLEQRIENNEKFDRGIAELMIKQCNDAIKVCSGVILILIPVAGYALYKIITKQT